MSGKSQPPCGEAKRVETLANGTGPAVIYEIAGRRFEIGSRGFADAVAEAHAAHQRPRCICVDEGVEMYVARLGQCFIVKRMPDTGSRHALDCPSYEPPAEISGLGHVLGSAIVEDPATGETTLKLDFPLTKMPGRSTTPTDGAASDSVSFPGTKLSLRGLLHYLWDQAELTRWHPGFAGKRNWATVRRHLLQAAEQKIASGNSLRARLYVPEPFSVDHRDAIGARRMSRWRRVLTAPGERQQLMLLVGEVKEIIPARYGFKAVVKHVPDQTFALDQVLYRRLERVFHQELAQWGSANDLHMVMIATFGLNPAGTPSICELSLMPVNSQWLPIADGFECQLVDRAMAEGRTFTKALSYNLARDLSGASITLTDTGTIGSPLYIYPPSRAEPALDNDRVSEHSKFKAAAWVWRPRMEPLPLLPPAVRATFPYRVRSV